MIIPYNLLQPQTLEALLSEFATRDGTDYGESEISLHTKVLQLKELLRKKEVYISYDEEEQSYNLLCARDITSQDINS